ncbi:MAG: sulfatase [Carboxylicivirga sp.]|jgi:arylsulfatase A-like enzyme|nr:sulfatase [Carboxylicivirga sp.]
MYSRILIPVLFLILLSCNTHKKQREVLKPNVVIFFLDDSGWGDFSPFGSPSYNTPNVQKLADDGCRYTNFYVPQAICSASRSALLTGCYPGRTKMFGAHGPNAKGVDPKFATMGEMFQQGGYRTAIFGKWHIGDQPETRPAARGFDESAGLMYSNDMWEHHATNPEYWGQWPLRYWKNNEITIEKVQPEHQKLLTTWAAQESVDFIDRNKENPFFLYVPFSMPHVPLFCSDKFEGKSGQGLYADVMMELDWAIGEVINKIKETGNEENTVIIFSSDNGPWAVYGEHAGVTPFREAKATSFDGGLKSACLIKYPPLIKKGSTVSKLICSIDLLPTLSNLTGVSLPENEIDGKNITPILLGDNKADNPHQYYAISKSNKFESVISGDGKWKLHMSHGYLTIIEGGRDGQAGVQENRKIDLSLFNLMEDPYEKNNVAEKHPDVVSNLKVIAEKHKEKFYSKKTK